MRAPRLSVIVPFHRNSAQLSECLRAIVPLEPSDELIVVGDEPQEPFEELARACGARTLTIRGPRGPAAARNCGAAAARGDVLVFIDADVVAARDALVKFRGFLSAHQEAAAVFGAYDEHPRQPGFLSQYRNLSHSYFHQAMRSHARTFWAGLGAVRREAFEAMGGFDERFGRPCVEDIELGYRLTSAGYRILVDPSIQGCHLKRWTLRSSILTDVRDRGIPWTQLILRSGGPHNDLNVSRDQRLSLVLAYVIIACLVGALRSRYALVPAVAALALFVRANWKYYSFFAARRGIGFAASVLPTHILHHLCNGVSFGVGCGLHYLSRLTGYALPGAIPQPESRTSMGNVPGIG